MKPKLCYPFRRLLVFTFIVFKCFARIRDWILCEVVWTINVLNIILLQLMLFIYFKWRLVNISIKINGYSYKITYYWILCIPIWLKSSWLKNKTQMYNLTYHNNVLWFNILDISSPENKLSSSDESESGGLSYC